MICIISGTNRPNSRTRTVAKQYEAILKERTDEELFFIDLCDIHSSIIHDQMYQESGLSADLQELQDNTLIPAKKWLIVMPEYNGSYPGILKLFLDAVSVRKYAETFKFKKLGLVGVASGRAGNLRGMDQMTNSMNYLGFSVMANKLPLSNINSLIDPETEEPTSDMDDLLIKHAKDFLLF